MSGVAGRVIAITGAGGGLGREYALLLARGGAQVVVNDLGGGRDGTGGSRSAADRVVDEIVEAGGTAVANHDDVSSAAGGAAVVQTALDAFGRIDGVVANAGILRDATFHKLDPADWDAVLRVHVGGTFAVLRAAWPHLREQQHGRIVVATSTSGIYGNFGQSSYGTAKSALIGLANTLAIEGRRYGILVNAVAPLAATRMTEDVTPPELLEQLSPAHVAPVVAYLLSDESTETGSTIVAGGGDVHRVQYFRSRGVTFPEVPTVDEVADRWREIVGMDDATPGVSPVG